MVRLKVVQAIFLRNFSSYFSGVLGYLFIVVFVALGGWLAFNDRFFTANEPNLDQLTIWFPRLLLFFIPAVTMSVWAEERKAGTDELLFTLPATDVEVLLGKYLSVLAVYSVALMFSMTHLIVLVYLGNPDWGLLFTTYFGYWIAGAALLSAGMLASILTSNMTVAFVLGGLICGIPVYIGDVGRMFYMGDSFESFSLNEQFRDFGMGVVPLPSLLYFAGFTLFMLYLNLVLMSKRHWDSNRTASTGLQFTARAICVGIVLTCVTVWAGYGAMRIDTTAERLFSLSKVTSTTLGELDSKRPIEIQAYLSPEVPREYVETRKRLIGLLRQFDELGGRNVEVRYVDVEPDSKEAEEAEDFGIRPQPVSSDREGRTTREDVFLGAVIISSYHKVVVPFFGNGLPIEYELTRSIQTVAQKEKLTVGILETDAGLMGGGRNWQIVRELEQQYEVIEVSPAVPITGDDFDVLFAVMPSSLTDSEMDNFVTYVKRGKPVLIFDDPFPLTMQGQFGVSNAPSQPKPSPGGGGMMGMGGQQPAPPKADGGRATRLLEALGIEWRYDQIAFDTTNPHAEIMLADEFVFVTRDSGGPDAINNESEITKGLQELLAIYPGTVRKRSSANVDFTPLLTTGASSGLLEWDQFTEQAGGFSMMGMQTGAAPREKPTGKKIDKSRHVIAAQLSGRGDQKVDAIFVADTDMIFDFFFQERNSGNLKEDLNIVFDNVSFVLNAVDYLAEEDTFFDLRSRRKKHRTLKTVEAKKQEFLEEANKQQTKADKEAADELEKRKKNLKERVDAIIKDENLDTVAKQQKVMTAQREETARLSLAEAQIEAKKQEAIRKIDRTTKQKTRELEKQIQKRAVWFPPIPALFLGIIVFITRSRSETLNVDPARRRV